MTFSYADPSSSRQDALRFLVGDTDPGQPLLQDEEFAYLVSLWGDKSDYRVASYCAEAIAAKLAREVDVSADSQSLGTNSLQEKYLTLAARMRSLDESTFPEKSSWAV